MYLWGENMKSLLCLFLVGVSLQAWAGVEPRQSPDEETLKLISEHNQQQALFESLNAHLRQENIRPVTPFAEYETTGYLFFNDDDYFGYAREIKNTIAQTLPEQATLVVYSTSASVSHLSNLRQRYSQLIDEDRLIILQVPASGSSNFWSRDALPVPVWTEEDFTLVDARYYYNFEPDAFLAELFSALKTKHNFFFEGGNFIANSLGDCIVVNRRRSYPGGVSDTAAIPDDVFRNQYGCQRLLRLRHLKGIGHSDEVVKFMSDHTVVTDTPEYVELLESFGYEVHLLPEPRGRFETYVNSLQVNNTLYVPTFNNTAVDQQALDIYRRVNPDLKLVALDSRSLSNRGQGGIHCITKNYPPVPINELIEQIGARQLEIQ
jgi:agmatine/peptidylarginine deiminase